MPRLLFVAVTTALTCCLPTPGQQNDPPKNFTNAIGIKFVWIPPGTFLMGSPKEEIGRQPDEIQHRVTLTKGFYMAVQLVSQKEWAAVTGNNPSHFEGEDDLPVDSVSWDDCQEFIRKLREDDKGKKPYRLPTEAEWEFACRANTTTPFYFGETISTDRANFDGNEVYGNGKKGIRRNRTTPVSSLPANAWGLHDMHGNRMQWCQDWHGGYPRDDVTDPHGPGKGDVRALRGGSWNIDPRNCRSAVRGGLEPDKRSTFIGVRVCFNLD